jgi:hypothetical protein
MKSMGGTSSWIQPGSVVLTQFVANCPVRDTAALQGTPICIGADVPDIRAGCDRKSGAIIDVSCWR